MARFLSKSIRLVALFSLLAEFCFSQGPATGTPVSGTFQSGPVDTINLGNLNIHFQIPIFVKPGKKLDFSASVVHDNLVIVPDSGTSWNFINTDWPVLTPAGASANATAVTDVECHDKPDGLQYSGFYFVDQNNTTHNFPNINVVDNHCIGGTAYQTAADGWLMVVKVDRTTNPPVPLTTTVTDPAGNTYSANLGLPDPIGFPFSMSAGPTSITDLNGNQIVVSDINTWIDSTGSPVLTVSGVVVAGSKTVTYSYPNPSGGSPENVAVNYSSLTQQTAFGCPGRSDYGVPTYFPTSINLPDGSSYGISYESTNGTYPSSTVTGRIHSLTLPTGATITYTYSGGTNGIVCSDSGPATLTKTTPDGMWKYTRTLNSNGTWQVKVTDPLNNETVYTFDSTSQIELQRLVYQGPTSAGILLQQDLICYNNNFTNCATTATINSQITQKDAYTYVAGIAQPRLSETTYLYNGILAGDKEFDFAPNAGRTNFISNRVIQYGSYSDGSCNGVTVGILPCSDATYANGRQIPSTQALYTYDSHGNLTNLQQYTGTTYLSESFTPNANGLNTVVTDVNGAQTSYTYGACNGSYPTLINEPLSLSKTLSWDCNGGVLTSVSDENTQPTNYSYIGDPFWRVKSVTDALQNVTNYNYTPTSIESSLVFNNNASTADVLTTLDSLGRVHLKQTRQAPGSANFDTVVYNYDANGRQSTVTVPCVSTAGIPCSGAPTTTTYDALNRPTLVTDGGITPGTLNYTYIGTDVLQAAGPPAPGENTKRRQMEYDGLGRLTSVCEVTNAAGSGTCGQASAQTGYWTKYSYDALGNLTGVTQNAQGTRRPVTMPMMA